MTLYLGLMSGTSMDAIDAALVDVGTPGLQVVATGVTPLEATLKRRLLRLIEHPDESQLDEIGQLDVEVGRAFAAGALALLRSAGVGAGQVAAIGSHGQTVRHRPDAPTPFTWQIGDPNTIAELTGITVVGDLRRRDVAAGGQGAPLVPVFHDQVFRSAAEDRIIVNVGGIANLTVLCRDRPLIGFDTGPGNRLLDAWIHTHRGLDYDAGGAWAASGRIDAPLLARLLAEPYLGQPAPKSTGRELFNDAWLRARLGAASPAPADVQATLLEFTAQSIARQARAEAPSAAVYLCGGGAHNAALREALSRLLAPNPVATTARLGLDPDFVEAAAFAWFAHRTLEGRTSSLAAVTGARGARVLGGIYRAGA